MSQDPAWSSSITRSGQPNPSTRAKPRCFTGLLATQTPSRTAATLSELLRWSRWQSRFGCQAVLQQCIAAVSPMREEPLMVKLVVACAAPIMAVALTGCSTSSHPPASPTSARVAPTAAPVPPAETLSTAVPAGVDSACEHAQFTPQQLTGDWTESGDTAVTTLSDDGTLRSSGGNQSGAWSYVPWASSPGKSSMPPGEEHQCVLWLHWQSPSPPTDLVYVPLKSTATSLELSFVGRGNTLTWVRPQPPA